MIYIMILVIKYLFTVVTFGNNTDFNSNYCEQEDLLQYKKQKTIITVDILKI